MNFTQNQPVIFVFFTHDDILDLFYPVWDDKDEIPVRSSWWFILMISRETDYAFRIIRALSSGERKSIQQICEQEHIPLAYAYKIVKKLDKAYLVRTFRGTTGGYELDCDLDKKTFYDVYRAIEGDLILNACQEAGSYCPHQHGQRRCNVHAVLGAMQEEFIEIMEKRSLRSVI